IRDARRGAKGHRGGGTDWPWDSGSDTRDAVAWEVEEGARAGVGSGHQDGEEVGERGVEAAAPAGTGRRADGVRGGDREAVSRSWLHRRGAVPRAAGRRTRGCTTRG